MSCCPWGKLGCFGPSGCGQRRLGEASTSKSDDDDLDHNDDALLWSTDLGVHSCGHYSFAIVQANEVIEDYAQVDTGSGITFVGVYDGHGGHEASKHVCKRLPSILAQLAEENNTISEDVIRRAVSATEDDVLAFVRRAFEIKPVVAAAGTCCLIGVIWKQTLYVANVGDSRAVLGFKDRSKKIVAEQLTRDHNASLEDVRQEHQSMHPDDPNIIIYRNSAWRVKGMTQVTRSIGDAYMKRSEFYLDANFPRFHLPNLVSKPLLRSDPDIFTRTLQPNDMFLIFASVGLWEHLTNQEAVEIVNKNPRKGIARRLLRAAVTEGGRKKNTSYEDVKEATKGLRRRKFHDDITVIVVFIDHELQGENIPLPELSVQGFVDAVGPSNFNFRKGTDENAGSSST